MTASTRAPFYDLFKLIVAIILLLIFLWLWLETKPAGTTPTNAAFALTSTTIPATAAPLPSSTVVPASATAPPPTTTPSPLPTFTSTPPAPTETLTPTETPVAEALPTPIVEIPADVTACKTVAHSQLQVGMKAMITRLVNFRASPGVLDNWLAVNHPNTQVEVIGGPACTRYVHGGAYLWWQIQLPDGRIGWSAEASAFGKYYFMEPVK